MTSKVSALLGRLLRGAVTALALGITALVVVLAAGSAAGRWRVWAVGATGARTGVTRDEALLLVPVPAQQIRSGDLIVMRRDHPGDAALYRVRVVTDTTKEKVSVADGRGTNVELQLPATVWRSSREIPYAGSVFRLAVGPIQAAGFVLLGIALIALAEFRRHPRRGSQSVVAAS